MLLSAKSSICWYDVAEGSDMLYIPGLYDYLSDFRTSSQPVCEQFMKQFLKMLQIFLSFIIC